MSVKVEILNPRTFYVVVPYDANGFPPGLETARESKMHFKFSEAVEALREFPVPELYRIAECIAGYVPTSGPKESPSSE